MKPDPDFTKIVPKLKISTLNFTSNCIATALEFPNSLEVNVMVLKQYNSMAWCRTIVTPSQM